MKRLLIWGAMFLCSMLTALAQFSGSGSGTEESPYLIFNVTQLSQLSNFGGQSGVVFRLMKDIDVSEWITDNNPRQGWTPIGVSATPFQGKLLGENHKITGLTITRASESYVGFFGYLSGATITDLTIEGSDVTGGSYVGTFAGYATNSNITNCHVKLTGKTSSSSGSYVGGFVGYATSCTISNFSTEAAVTSTGANYVGGFAGSISGTLSDGAINGNVTSNKPYTGGLAGTGSPNVSNTNVTGEVKGTTYVGGFIGDGGGSLTNCSVNGNVTGQDYLGGFIGQASSSTFKTCNYTGDISGNAYIGGVAGNLAAGSSSTFTSCFTKGKIKATGDYVGGIVGASQGGCIAGMESCSHFGDIDGKSYVGGLIGSQTNTSDNAPTLSKWVVRYDWYSSSTSTGYPSSATSCSSAYSGSDELVSGTDAVVNINNCVAIGNIVGTDYVGGLIGKETSASGYTSENVAISGSVSASSSNRYYYFSLFENGNRVATSSSGYVTTASFNFSGRRKKYTQNTYTIDVTNNTFSGNVYGEKYVGGIAGYKRGGCIKTNYSNCTVQGEENIGGIAGYIEGEYRHAIAVESNASICSIIAATKPNAGRIYGKSGDYISIGAIGSTQGNRALVTTKVVKSGILQEVNDDLQNGTSIGASALKLKATYGALGWNYDNDWNQLETESYPYKKYQAAPPTITSTLESQATSISGRSTDGGTVYLYYKDKEPVSTVCNGNDWTFTTEPLQSGAQVQVYADAEGMTPSYFATTNVSYPGLGTEVAPYLIYTAEDLQGVNKSGYYKLMNDIDLTSWINENSPTEGWPAIGMNGSEAVYIDGDYHKIKGLWTNTTKDFNGLFSSFLVGQIKNLTVEVASGKKVKGGDYTGILIGRMANAKIMNCTVKGDVEGTLHVGGIAAAVDNTDLENLKYTGNAKTSTANAYVGGIVGIATGGSMKSCQVEGDVTGSLYVGGITGLTSDAELNSLTYSGNLSTESEGAFVGGLIGNAQNCSLVDANAVPTISAAGTYIGGLIGKAENCTMASGNAMPNITSSGNTAYVGGAIGYAGEGEVTKSVAYNTITTSGTSNNVGGLVGYSSAAITLSNANGSITVTGEDSYTGGLVGYALGSVTNCYSTASVKGTKYVAGLVAYTSSTIDKCYAKGNVIGHFYGAGVVAYMDGESAATTNCVAMNSTLSLTASTAWACRVIGGYGNGCPDPNESNYALKTMQVSMNGSPQQKYDDIMEGTAKTQAELMQSTTYLGIGWDLTNDWALDENETYPTLLWEIDANPVTEISFDNTSLLLAVDKTETINATVLPLSASNKRLTWTSSNTNVATVEDGVVTAVSVGSATITATSTDGSNVSATCQVTVTANKDAAIAELQAKLDEAQALYDYSTEGEEIGQYTTGSRAELLDVINRVSANISDTMDDSDLAQGLADIQAAITLFQSKKISGGDDTDISQLNNVIYIENVEANAGKQLTLSVKMKNSVEVQGFGFDLYLPDGVTVAEDEDGFSLVTLSTERTTEKKTNYFDSNIMDGGFLRVLASSTKGYTISGTDGEIVQIIVNIDKDMEAGDYPIILKEIALSDNNSQGYETAYVKSTLTISSYTPGDVDGNGKINVVDFTAIANYILGKAPVGFIEKAADVSGDSKVNVVDLTAVANLILYGSTGQQNARGMGARPGAIYLGEVEER